MYYDLNEHPARVKKLAAYLNENNLDFAIIYYDETNVANGWYLTAWCPQFESGCVLVSKDGTLAFADTLAEQQANERLAKSRGV